MAWEMIGHAWAVELLQKHLTGGRVRHAYLFTGPNGVGKRTLALRFARVLACESPPLAGEACGTCRACGQIAAQSYPDLHVVSRRLGESQIPIDQIRELQHQLALAPYAGRCRVALLADFHDASLPAQNALLKTLEEPSSRVVLLVTAREPESLLPTIVSRCEVVALRGLPAGELAAALAAMGETPDRSALLAALAAGRPGRALQLRGEPQLLELRAQALDELQRLLGAGRPEQFDYVDRLVGKKSREDDLEAKRRKAVEVLETWLSLWRDAMLAAYGVQAPLANPDRGRDLKRLKVAVPPSEVVAAVRATERTIESLRRNANLTLAMETLMLDMPRVPGGP